MLRLFIYFMFAGPSRQSTRDGSMSFWRYSGVPPRSLMVQRITGLRLSGHGPSEKRLGCRCTLTWYKKRIMYGHKTLWDLWNGDLTLAEKTLTPLTDAHMTEVERGLRTSKGNPSCKRLGC